MALSAKLELRNSQQLVMTPQLQQAIQLLQLSNLELVQFVETELERNPLLERDESGSEGESLTRKEDGEGNSSPEFSEGMEAKGDDENWLNLEKRVDGNELDTDFENVFPDRAQTNSAADAQASDPYAGTSSWSNGRARSSNFDDDDMNLESIVASEISLKDHLAQQLPLALADPADRLIGQHLIDSVDEAGYVRANLGNVGDRLGASEEQVQRVLGVLQTFDPPGIFARSLGECLALQLRELNHYDPQIALLLEHLDKLAAHDINGLRKAVGVDMEELTDMINEIKQLNPKPGLKFGSVQVQPIVPDVIVRMASDGSWLVELNSETLPRVLVNRTYFTRVSKTANSERDKGYLVDCLQTANWLVKSLDQRARTILRVAEEIVRQQDGFFTYGVQHLRPLNLKTVAEAISMHESTVSRVTSNKYVATARGIFELKYFFTSAIASSEHGEAHSSEAVRHRIRQLIDGETPKSILSDDRIVEMLKTDGIDIARRTVAKYREAMRIPSSVQRRREKRMMQSIADGV